MLLRDFPVSEHCRDASAFPGRCRGRVSFPHKAIRRSDALYSGKTVRALL